MRGFEFKSVQPDDADWLVLWPVDFVPAAGDEEFVAAPEAFPYPGVYMGGEPAVYAWTEATLLRMDKLGIAFPVAASLCGPVMLPSAKDDSVLVPVWYSVRDDADGAASSIADAVTWLVENLMAEDVTDEMLSGEDKRFLASHYSFAVDGSVENVNDLYLKLWGSA